MLCNFHIASCAAPVHVSCLCSSSLLIRRANERVSLVSVIYAIISEQLSSAVSETTAMCAHADTLTTDLDISVKESTFVNLAFHMCLADVGLLVSPIGGRGASVLSVILPVTQMMVCFFGGKSPSMRLLSTVCTYCWNKCPGRQP